MSIKRRTSHRVGIRRLVLQHRLAGFVGGLVGGLVGGFVGGLVVGRFVGGLVGGLVLALTGGLVGGLAGAGVRGLVDGLLLHCPMVEFLLKTQVPVLEQRVFRLQSR
jgi:outer membrane lipoprotein SlyB